MKLELRKVRLPLSEFVLEADVEIASDRTAIFGPSGAGKTSLLEDIAGHTPLFLVKGYRRAAQGGLRFDPFQ